MGQLLLRNHAGILVTVRAYAVMAKMGTKLALVPGPFPSVPSLCMSGEVILLLEFSSQDSHSVAQNILDSQAPALPHTHTSSTHGHRHIKIKIHLKEVTSFRSFMLGAWFLVYF